jgi:DNA-binding response OmpR family regulator
MADTEQRILSILVLEDEFIIADEIATILQDAGHSVVGPMASIDAAMAGLDNGVRPDAAIIDANIRGDSSAALAKRLRELNVPFCLCTGYRSGDLGNEFGDVAIVQKPVSPGVLLATIVALANAGPRR